MANKTTLFGTTVRGSTFSGGGATTQSQPNAAAPSSVGAPRNTTSNGNTAPVQFLQNVSIGSTPLQTIASSNGLPMTLAKFVYKNFPLRVSFTDSKINGQVRIQNSQFVPVTESGLSNFRPEILSMTNFLPIWEQGALRNIGQSLNGPSYIRQNTPAGDYINFQYQTKALRQETLTGLIKNIKTAASKDPFVDIKSEYDTQLKNVQQLLQNVDNVYRNISVIKESLEIKTIPEQAYEIIENSIPTQIPPLQEFFDTRMGYRKEQYARFSETKIVLQLIFDITNMLQNYSVNLISVSDNDRLNDYNPITIDTSYGIQNAFTFDMNRFSSGDTIINANGEDFFNSFMNSLPIDIDQKIRLLTYLLAKEYLVSNGMGDSKNTDLLTFFNISRDNGRNLFENILGTPGSTIFQRPTTINRGQSKSLASLTYISSDIPNAYILALESKYIDDERNNVVYIPGASYFTDNIVAVGGTDWNTKPYTDYAAQFNLVVNNTLSLVRSLLKLDVIDRNGNVVANATGVSKTQPSNISPSTLNRKILETIYSSFNSLTANEEQYLSVLGQQSSNIIEILSLEEKKRYVEDILLRITDRIARIDVSAELRDQAITDVQARINADLATIESRISTLNIPPVTKDIKILFDQSVLTAIFKAASQNSQTLTLKRLLYQYCIIAAFCKNKFYVGTGIFSLLASTEFKNAFDIYPEGSDGTGFDNTLTTDGTGLTTGVLRSIVKSIAENVIALVTEASNEAGRAISGNSELQFYVSKNEIIEILTNCALGTGPSGNDNMVSYFINLANELFNSSQINGVNVQLLSDNNRTRFNSLSLSTQLLFLFEILCEYSVRYSAWSFTNSKQINVESTIYTLDAYYATSDTVRTVAAAGVVSAERKSEIFSNSSRETDVLNNAYISVKLDYVQNNKIEEAIKNILNNVPEEERQNLRQSNEYYQSLEDNSNRIADELTGIRNGLGIWDVINNKVQVSANTIQNFFNQKELKTFLKNTDPNSLNLFQSPAQAKLATYIYNDIKDRGANNNSLVFNSGGTEANSTDEKEKELIVSNTIIPSEYNSLISMLSRQNPGLNASGFITYPTTEMSAMMLKRTNKILTIGIPSGFSKQLVDRIDIKNLDLLGVNKETDIIYVNVYPVDLRFEEIVFKPYRYVFDLSLFISKKNLLDLNATNVEAYENLVDRVELTDLADIFNPTLTSFPKIAANEKYNFLSLLQKRQIVLNHLNSYLLGIYVNILTGTRTSEEQYMSPETVKSLTEKTYTAIKNYAKQVGEETPLSYNTTELILQDSILTEKVKDMYRLMTYGSLVFNKDEVKNLVSYPKKFERIFNLPINLDYMEIDFEQTMSTTAGQLALTKKENINLFEFRNGIPFKLRTNEPDSFIMKKVMIAIETAVATSSSNQSKKSQPSINANRLTTG